MGDKDKKTDWPARTFRILPELPELLELLERLDAYCKRTGISKTFVIEKALEKYLEDNPVNG